MNPGLNGSERPFQTRPGSDSPPETGRTLRDVSSMLPPVLSILNMFKPSAKAGQCTCVFPTACSIRTV